MQRDIMVHAPDCSNTNHTSSIEDKNGPPTFIINPRLSPPARKSIRGRSDRISAIDEIFVTRSGDVRTARRIVRPPLLKRPPRPPRWLFLQRIYSHAHLLLRSKAAHRGPPSRRRIRWQFGNLMVGDI